MTRDALEERRIYGGGSYEQAVAEVKAGMDEALAEGYLLDRIEWATDSRSVAVTYVYDPARAARPV